MSWLVGVGEVKKNVNQVQEMAWLLWDKEDLVEQMMARWQLAS